MIKLTTTDSERQTMLIGEDIRDFLSMRKHIFPYCNHDMRGKKDWIKEKFTCSGVHDLVMPKGAQKGKVELGTGWNNYSGP